MNTRQLRKWKKEKTESVLILIIAALLASIFGAVFEEPAAIIAAMPFYALATLGLLSIAFTTTKKRTKKRGA